MGAWAIRRVTKDEALSRLARMPESETGHGTAVPMPFSDRREYEDKFGNEAINEAIKRAPVENVEIASLRAIQHSVKPERVAQYVHDPNLKPPSGIHPRAGTPVDLPVVVEVNGKRYLHDGHHRTVARLLEGHRTIRARVARLGGESTEAA